MPSIEGGNCVYFPGRECAPGTLPETYVSEPPAAREYPRKPAGSSTFGPCAVARKILFSSRPRPPGDPSSFAIGVLVHSSRTVVPVTRSSHRQSYGEQFLGGSEGIECSKCGPPQSVDLFRIRRSVTPQSGFHCPTGMCSFAASKRSGTSVLDHPVHGQSPRIFQSPFPRRPGSPPVWAPVRSERQRAWPPEGEVPAARKIRPLHRNTVPPPCRYG
jgi:hypothetical protein